MVHATETAPSLGPAAPTASIDRSTSRWPDRAVGSVERNWRWVLGALMLVDAALLLYMGRGLSFFYDDWNFVTQDYGGGVHSLLVAHVGNISVFPIAIYKVLFHLVGLNHYAVFRLVVIVLHLACAGLVYVLAARRVSRVPALLAAALILFLGAAWEDLLWAFQVGYMLSVAGGLAAWVLIEQRGRRSELAAMLCVVVSAGSSSLGIAVMVGVAAELAWERRWRSAWIVVVPALLYALWYLGYGESQITEGGLVNAPGFAADLAAAAFGGLLGRGLEWGRPLALIGALLVGRRLVRPLPVSARLVGLLATGIGLWVITAVARSTVSQPEASRYIYLGAVVIVLAGTELLREVTVTSRAAALATAVVGICAITGLTVLRAGSMSLRSNSETVTAELGALELAASHASPGYQPDPQRAPQITAGPYLHTVRAIGSTPADAPAAISASNAVSRAGADAVLMQLGVAKLAPLGAVVSPKSAPVVVVSSLAGARMLRSGGCVQLTPFTGMQMTAVLSLPRGGVAIHNAGPDSASLALRRFGETFDPLSSPVNPRSTASLAIAPDSARAAWQLQVVSGSQLSVCGLSSGGLA